MSRTSEKVEPEVHLYRIGIESYDTGRKSGMWHIAATSPGAVADYMNLEFFHEGWYGHGEPKEREVRRNGIIETQEGKVPGSNQWGSWVDLGPITTEQLEVLQTFEIVTSGIVRGVDFKLKGDPTFYTISPTDDAQGNLAFIINVFSFTNERLGFLDRGVIKRSVPEYFSVHLGNKEAAAKRARSAAEKAGFAPLSSMASNIYRGD